MRWVVVAVGRLKNVHCQALCQDYLQRLCRYQKANVLEARNDEQLERVLPTRGRLVALTRRGNRWTSRELAARCERWKIDAREVTFVIGGAEGLPESLLARAEERWSLSPLTLPHELARVVVLEQLYRAESILAGEPYHRDR